MGERYTTGLPKLDGLLGGGLPRNTVTLLSGGPGTGKTLIGLNYLIEGARNGENCCYLTLNEGRSDLLRACTLEPLKSIQGYLDKNLVIEPLELGREADIAYFETLFRAYPRTDRLVIDNLNKLLIYAENRRQYRITLSNTVKYLREKISSTILICETEDNKTDTGNGEAFECDGVIRLSFLDLEEKPKRTLEIPKMRYTAIEPRIQHELTINDKGIELTETQII
jgi:circadian clock protein KaiC